MANVNQHQYMKSWIVMCTENDNAPAEPSAQK